MKTWGKVMLYALLPIAFVWHYAQKAGKYMERKSKPAIAMLVAMTMMLSIMPMTAFALSVAPHTHPVCGKTHTNIGDHTGACADIEWTSVHNETELINALQTGGNYYLADNITISTSSNKVASGVTVNLCLNGKTLTRETYGITVYSATLNICDCVGTGNLTGNTNAAPIYLYIDTTATLNLYGGSISGNTVSNDGAVSVARGTTFNMYGGSISNNSTSHGTVRALSTFHMYGGEISGNECTSGAAGGVYVSGTAIIEDGAVIVNNSSKRGGGGIHVESNGAVTINGGTITGNSAKGTGTYAGGGGISFKYGMLTINGGIITGNTNANGDKDNVYVGAGQTITVGTLANNTNIGVKMSNSIGTFTSGGAAYADKFTSDNSSYEVAVDGNNLKLAVPHTHKYIYSTFDNVITESCTCGHSETATLNAPSGDVVYDNTEKIATVSYSENWKGGNLTVTHNNNINAGDLSASASISIKGAIAEIYWTILVATPSYDIPTALTATYGETLADVTLPTATNGIWTWVNKTTSVGNVGSKTFKAIFTPNDNNNYITVEVDVPVTVSKADPQHTVPTGISATYGEILADITLPEGWGWNDPLTTSVGNVGTKTVVAIFTPTDTENYKTVKADITVTVRKADSTYTAPTARPNLVYNGDALELINAGSAVGGEMQYVLGTNITTAPANNWSTTIPTGKNAGTYYIWYRVVGDGNHNDVAPACVAVAIAKAPLTVTANNKTITYGDTPANNGVTYAGFVSNEIEHVLGGTLEYDYGYAQYGDVGNYDITPKGLTSDNYEITFQKGVLTVEQREISIHWGGTQFIPYNGNKQVPEVTAGNLVNGDTCQISVEVVETTESAGVNPGQWTARIIGLSNTNYKLPANSNLVEVKYTIYGTQSAPAVVGVGETVKGKNDGYIAGLTTEMEYATEPTNLNSAYTKITDPNMIFAPGTYYVRYAAKDYYYFSPYTEVTVVAGRMLTVTVPQNQVGYTLTVDKSTLDWREEFTLTYTLEDGYTELSNFAVEVNGSPVTLAGDNYTVTNPEMDIVITVRGVADNTAPAAEIDVKNNKWTSFWNGITFGLLFNETQDVTITATDLGSKVNTIQYYLASGELSEDEVEVITDWQDYNGTFKINPDNKYVVYAKITDNAGNTLIINSNGIVLDATAPVINGIENGQNYYGQVVFTVTDALADIDKVEIDGVDKTHFESQYVINPDNQEHTVIATDKAGNAIEYKVTVYKNYTVTYKVDGNVVDTQTVGHGKDATAPAISEKEGYTQTAPTWDKDSKNITADTEINAVYTINEYTITFIDENGVFKVLTCKHGETVTMPDVPEKDGYTVKWETTIGKVTGDVSIKAVYTQIPKSDTPSSAQTGDSSNLWLWVALAFVSGGMLFGAIFWKKKEEAKEN